MRLFFWHIWIVLLCLSLCVSAQSLDSLENAKFTFYDSIERESLDVKLQEELSAFLDETAHRSSSLKENQTIRVLLEKNLSSVKLRHSGPIYVYALGSRTTHKINEAGTLNISVKDGQIYAEGIVSAHPFVVDPQVPSYVTFDNQSLKKGVYNGVLYFIPHDDKMMIVEYNDFEEYLLGVLSREVSHSWNPEALKAQAVAARSYAYYKMRKQDPNYDVRSTASEQAYKGSAGVINQSIYDAVNNTRGQVLTHGGKFFLTFYHANCGGYTLDGKILTGRDIPALKGRICTACKNTYNSYWKVTLSNEIIDSFVRQNTGITEPVEVIEIAEEDSDPRFVEAAVKEVISFRFITERESAILTCKALQKKVGTKKLKTCKIEKVRRDDAAQGFVFSGRGFGHGVGLCQDGANGMAREGATYWEILKAYFGGTEKDRKLNKLRMITLYK